MKNCSFTDIIKKYEIIIPMIQRDYAQGRDDAEVKKVRGALLKDIYTAIQKHEIIKLDFVYGYIERIDKQEMFIPLDGQQRLTTLFLLHCFTAIKSKNFTDKAYLNNFRYETRASSTDFTNALVKNIEHICNKQDEKISRKIKNSSWFFTSWEHDPTVLAMLTMLDAIEEMHVELSYESLDKIKFDFINLNEFRLSDDLYLKMNARGVQLTPFEKFKATFQKILEKKEFDNLKEEFKAKIDGEWLDLFWNMDKNKDASIFTKSVTMTCSEKKEYKYRTIDDAFMRFFWYITEMLYFKNDLGKKDTFSYDKNGNPIIDYNLIDGVYQDSSSVEFFFQSLNNIKILNEKIEETCFYHQDDSGKNRVALFKGKNEEYNFLIRSLKNGKLTDYEKLTLFAIVKYVNELSLDSERFTDNLRDLIRVVRNLLQQIREWQNNKIKFESKLDASKYHLILKAICNDFIGPKNIYEILSSNQVLKDATEAFKSDYFEHERQKALIFMAKPSTKKVTCKLEDHILIKGSTHNFYLEDVNLLEGRARAFFDIWGDKKSHEDREIVEGFLGVIDYSVNIWNGHGKFFGGGDDGWRSILTFYRKNDNLVKFLDAYNQCGSLESIKYKYLLDTTTQKDWRYYFVKYPSMTTNYHLLYAWILSENNGFSIRHLGQYQFNGYHINPYARTVINIINDKTICCIDSSRSKTSDRSPLLLKKNNFTYKSYINDHIRGYYLKLFCEDKGWRVSPALSSINQYSQVKPTEDFYLKPTETMDMIEVAVAFICELYQLENPLDKNKVVDSYAEVVA